MHNEKCSVLLSLVFAEDADLLHKPPHVRYQPNCSHSLLNGDNSIMPVSVKEAQKPGQVSICTSNKTQDAP